MSETHRWIGVLSALVGAWVAASSLVLDVVGGHFWSNIVVGAAVVALAGYSALHASPGERPSPWASGLAALLGLWLVATPFVYGVGTRATFAFDATTAPMWSGLVSGIAIAVLSGYNAYVASEPPEVRTAESVRA